MLHKRENRAKIRKGKIIQWSIFLILLIYLMITFISQQSVLEGAKDQYNESIKQLNENERINIELQAEYASINTDEFYEKIAREILKYISPDEKVFYESQN